MALINCPKCGGQVSSTANQCPHCGTSFTVCPECGKVVADTPEVCPYCGYHLKQGVGPDVNAVNNQNVKPANNNGYTAVNNSYAYAANTQNVNYGAPNSAAVAAPANFTVDSMLGANFSSKKSLLNGIRYAVNIVTSLQVVFVAVVIIIIITQSATMSYEDILISLGSSRSLLNILIVYCSCSMFLIGLLNGIGEIYVGSSCGKWIKQNNIDLRPFLYYAKNEEWLSDFKKKNKCKWIDYAVYLSEVPKDNAILIAKSIVNIILHFILAIVLFILGQEVLDLFDSLLIASMTNLYYDTMTLFKPTFIKLAVYLVITIIQGIATSSLNAVLKGKIKTWINSY